MKYFIILLFLNIYLTCSGQNTEQVTYYANIQPILQKHCVNCHQAGSIAPFGLDNWEDVNARAIMIAAVTTSKYMPPWRADSSFQHYKNENYLNQNEIDLIKKWVETGKEKGVSVKVKKAKPIKEQKSNNKLEIGYHKSFIVEGDNREEFRFFHLPSKLDQPRFIKSIEFVPGNKGVVHHSRIMIDTTNEISGIDGMSEEDPSILNFQKKPLADPFLFGWVPGNNKITFPPGIGKRFMQIRTLY